MPPDYEPDELADTAVWGRVLLTGHGEHGGWFRDMGQQPVCACGSPVPGAMQPRTRADSPAAETGVPS